MGAAVNDYREKAEECLRAAEKMRNPAERIEMLGIARNYMALADHARRSKVNSPQTIASFHHSNTSGRPAARPWSNDRNVVRRGTGNSDRQ